MTMLSRASWIGILAAVLAIGVSHAQTSGTISIEQPFTRATPGNSKVGAGYLTIVNKGSEADRLVSASSPAADKVEVHEMTMQDGVMKMRALAGGLPVEAGKTVALTPGGNHLMLMGLKAPLKQGGKVPVTLKFEKAGAIDVTLDVQAIGARSPGGMSMPSGDGGHMHNMHNM